MLEFIWLVWHTVLEGDSTPSQYQHYLFDLYVVSATLSPLLPLCRTCPNYWCMSLKKCHESSELGQPWACNLGFYIRVNVVYRRHTGWWTISWETMNHPQLAGQRFKKAWTEAHATPASNCGKSLICFAAKGTFADTRPDSARTFVSAESQCLNDNRSQHVLSVHGFCCLPVPVACGAFDFEMNIFNCSGWYFFLKPECDVVYHKAMINQKQALVLSCEVPGKAFLLGASQNAEKLSKVFRRLHATPKCICGVKLTASRAREHMFDFFSSKSDVHILYGIFHGHAGSWKLSDGTSLGFDDILEQWDLAKEQGTAGQLLIVSDACESGCMVQQAQVKDRKDIAVQASCSGNSSIPDNTGETFTELLLWHMKGRPETKSKDSAMGGEYGRQRALLNFDPCYHCPDPDVYRDWWIFINETGADDIFGTPSLTPDSSKVPSFRSLPTETEDTQEHDEIQVRGLPPPPSEPRAPEALAEPDGGQDGVNESFDGSWVLEKIVILDLCILARCVRDCVLLWPSLMTQLSNQHAGTSTVKENDATIVKAIAMTVALVRTVTGWRIAWLTSNQEDGKMWWIGPLLRRNSCVLSVGLLCVFCQPFANPNGFCRGLRLRSCYCQ